MTAERGSAVSATPSVGHRLHQTGASNEDARHPLARALVASALHLLPAGTPVYAQVATGNVASLRALIAGGLRPVCAEVLFPRDATAVS